MHLLLGLGGTLRSGRQQAAKVLNSLCESLEEARNKAEYDENRSAQNAGNQIVQADHIEIIAPVL